jgi:hypothetical protein
VRLETGLKKGVTAMTQLQLFETETCPLIQSELDGIARIEEMIRRGDQPVGDILRQIALQIAIVCGQSFKHLGKGTSKKHLVEKIRCYCGLQKTLLVSEAHSRADNLNLDGAKFRFVLAELVSLFKTGMQNAGTLNSQRALYDPLIANVVRTFHPGDLSRAW